MRTVTVAATQMACSWETTKNIDRAEWLVRKAAGRGANVVLIQELFETPYFCIEQDNRHLGLASSLAHSPVVRRMSDLAKELNVVLPTSFFEQSGNVFFNSVAMIDAGGEVLGIYRKSHIPNEIGYQEKYYFSPGDTGFRVWETRFARIGLGICWDQWFPEAARCMALQRAELLLYPTAIGSEPGAPGLDSVVHWQNVMCGHAAANIMPVVASNRIGVENGASDRLQMRFYGSSFIADHTGCKVEEANRCDQAILVHQFDLTEIAAYRQSWGVFRDRRPELYRALGTLDGQVAC